MRSKHQRFVAEYLIDLNATQAAVRAGYSPHSAGKQGSSLLRRPDVAEAVAAGKAALVDRATVTAERVLQAYAEIAFANMADYARFGPDGLGLIDMANLSRAQTAAIAEVTESKTGRGGTVRFKLHDKLAALNALARYLGLSLPDAPPPAPDADADPPDAYEIARQIAFALKRGEAGRESPRDS